MSSIQELRALTGAGIVACQKALRDSNGNLEQAAQLLRQRGLDKAGAYSDRVTKAGTVGTYVHHDGTLGAMIVLGCETDFVARTAEFKELANTLAMQVAATNPSWESRTGLPEHATDNELALAAGKVKDGLPDQVRERIITGHMDKFYQEKCLMEQVLVTDSKTKIEDLVKLFSSKCGEKIEVKSFKRLAI